MPSIISATDFSDIALNATYYACEMAMAYKSGITIFHSYIVPVSFADTPLPVISVAEARDMAEEQMQALLEKLNVRYPNLEITTVVNYGEITESLKEYAEESHPILVVLGNSNEDGSNTFLGGNLLSELRTLPCPVMAIPSNIEFKPISRICLSCDFKNIEEHLPATEVINLVTWSGASLHVLNIDFDNKNFGVDTPLESTALHDMLQLLSPDYHYVEDKDVDSAITSFIQENRIDWLMIIPHKYNFFERLFHRSHTKHLVEQVHIPIIALPER